MKFAIRIGGILVVAGLLALIGYGLFEFAKALFGSGSVPVVVQAAVAAIVVGFLLLIAAVVIEQVRGGGREEMEEVEF